VLYEKKRRRRLRDGHRPRCSTPSVKGRGGLESGFRARRNDVTCAVSSDGAGDRRSSPEPTSASSPDHRRRGGKVRSYGRGPRSRREPGQAVIAPSMASRSGRLRDGDGLAPFESPRRARSSDNRKSSWESFRRRRNTRLPRLVGKGRALQIILSERSSARRRPIGWAGEQVVPVAV